MLVIDRDQRFQLIMPDLVDCTEKPKPQIVDIDMLEQRTEFGFVRRCCGPDPEDITVTSRKVGAPRLDLRGRATIRTDEFDHIVEPLGECMVRYPEHALA